MMQLEFKSQPAPTPSSDIHHLTCCDDNLSLCGLDVVMLPENDGTGEQQCLVCYDLDEQEIPCQKITCEFYGGLMWL